MRKEAKKKDETTERKIFKLKKREPLPMKFRALPQSFWQQPNKVATLSPSTFAPAPLNEEDDSLPMRNLVVGAANTELLFSLFENIPSRDGEPKKLTSKRGRPRKNKDLTISRPKDDDPYVTSATVPEVKIQQDAVRESKKAEALLSFHKEIFNDTLQRTYSQRLNDLVVNL